MKFGGGYGIKYLGEPGADVGIDYYFWGGAFNTFFWIDRDNGHFGVFAINHCLLSTISRMTLSRLSMRQNYKNYQVNVWVINEFKD